jgi:hypothetical protein
MILAIFIYLAGLFTGTTAVLVVYLLDQKKLTRQFDRERMKLTNKAFIREGSQSLFSEEDIDGAAAGNGAQTPAPSKPRTFTSAFRAGKQRMQANLESQKKSEAGQNLPEPLKFTITKAAEEAKAAAGVN